jgi:pectin methylesterase-like acyl-CoA thioesterase
MTYSGFVRVASPTVYVTPGTGSGTFPYNTPESGFANIKSAVDNAIDGNTLLLGAGIYETGNELVVDKSITILGTAAKPEDVIVRNTVASQGHRTMRVENARAFIANLTIENGYNNIGANLRLAEGVVSNCIIRGGTAVASSNGAGAGVEFAGAGTLTHCVISNNVVQGTSSDGGMTGGAIYLPYNSKNGRISNCLVAYNRYVTSGETVKAGTAGIRFFGENNETKVENCTIAANTVEGTLSDDSAGIYCTSWSVRFRNNIIAGNYETGKDRFTAARIDEHCTNVRNLTDADASATSLFRKFASGDFVISASSAAYDTGVTDGLTLLPSTDLAGKPRIYGKAIDVGCYECQALPRTMIILR